MRNRSVFALLSLFVGCASPEGPLPPLGTEACGERLPAGSMVEMASSSTGFARARLGPCGDLLWLDGAGEVFRAGPELVEASAVLSGVAGLDTSRLGDQAFVTGMDGSVSWVRLDAPDDAVALDEVPDARGFVRDGDRERAWACVGSTLGVVGEGGLTPVVEDVGTCRVWAAPDAPVVAYVDDGFELAVVDLVDGERRSMAEVPYVAASDDQVRLSRDGQLLFHQPSASPTSRIGIFDLRLREGHRLLAAPEVRTSISGLTVAQRAGHTVAMRSPDGVLIVTPAGYVNHYPDATLVALSPEGDRALLTTVGAVGELYQLTLTELDAATLTRLGGVSAEARSAVTSSDGDLVVSWGRLPSNGTRAATMVWRWSTEVFVESVGPNVAQAPSWVGPAGAMIQRIDDDVVMRTLGGEPIHRWPDSWLSQVVEVGDGTEALLRIRHTDGVERLVVAPTGGGAPRVIFESDGMTENLRGTWVDGDGERVAFQVDDLSAPTPTGPRSTIYAGAL